MKGLVNTKETGITLIVLAVTIAVIFILAAVTISATLGDNGVVQEAKYSKAAQEQQVIKSQIEAIVATWEVESTLNDENNVTTLWQKLKSAGIIKNNPTYNESKGVYILATTAGEIELRLEERNGTEWNRTTRKGSR